MTIGEYKCIIPRMPAEKHFLNAGRKTKDQKFEHTIIPTGLRRSFDEEKIVRREYHRRYHGVWIMLNGSPYYITGRAYHFFNYWTTTNGKRPDFRMEAVEFYTLWDDIYMDLDCYGLLDIKCRRLGDTEKGLHLAYEEMTRMRNTTVGMQHMKEDDAQKNYLRLVNGHKYMAYFFRPQSRGSTAPQKKLELLYPSQAITAKNAKEKDLFEDDHVLPSLGSSCDYEVTKVRAYDGQRIEFYFGDEYGKIDPKTMNQLEQLGVVRRCMSLNNGRDIIGKGYLPTTVEDVSNGTSVEMMQKLWDYSAPVEEGRTISGLRRIFRGFQLAAECDEYGFHKVKEAEEWRDEEIQKLLDVGDFAEVINLQRKQPKDVHEALQIAASDCTLNPHLLDLRLMEIKKDPPIIQVGNLEWTEGFGSNVEFIAHPKGKWRISQFPLIKNKRVTTDYGYGPGNGHIYAAGGDPIDSKAKKGSEGALAIFRKMNMAAESKCEIDIHGNIIDTENMATNQFVCTYRHRPDNPEDYFQDALKTAIFYGVPVFFELQKPYVVNKFRDAGFNSYLAKRPRETISNVREKNNASRQEGAAATGPIISLYVDALKVHISRMWRAYKDIDQLRDMRKFNTDNRGERDLTVASGYALLSGMDSRMKTEIEDMANRWNEVPFKKIPNKPVHA
jgi:hypothetical protein